MTDLSRFEVWLLTGSQHLYGPDTLAKVDEHARAVADGLSASPHIPFTVKWTPVLTTPEGIAAVCRDASASPSCIGVITWMHTFSPAKMWIGGLRNLTKPLLDLHTQFARELPWGTIDMDFMNLHQTAHGGREFNHLLTRLNRPRKIVVGSWQDEQVQKRIGIWARTAAGWADAQGMAVARFGDNMRNVSVTEGDKVEAERQLGFSVNGYGVGDLADVIRSVTEKEIDALIEEYTKKYSVAASLQKGGAKHPSLREAAKIEAGVRTFLQRGSFKAFTTTFEDLHGLTQLPGLSVQRLMNEGYGFGAEGDWKTAALLRMMKVMAAGLPGGTSFMEDYTYHLVPGKERVLGAHMLEICESLAREKPSLEIHPLSIGGKADPPRLVFTAPPGPAVNVTLVDTGDRFRLIVNEVDAVAPDKPLPALPVAHAVWIPRPNFSTAAETWMLAGGSHHTVFSQALTTEYLEDLAEMAGLELLVIDKSTTVRSFKKELLWNHRGYAGG